MRVGIEGAGIWATGCTSWDDFCFGLTNGFTDQAEAPALPKPENIPARERRRAPHTVKLALEVIGQAADMANTDECELCSVFASAMGDSYITDYMCRSLASCEKALSPTRFHNSVHNTPSGYWSIAAGNRWPSSFISVFRNSTAGALLEACAVAETEQRPTVLALYDVAFGQPLYDTCPIDEDFAAALIINPDSRKSRWTLDITIDEQPASNPTSDNVYITERIAANPSASILLIFEFLFSKDQKSLKWPLAAATGCSLRLSKA